ncbi:MAG: hypothetical protein NC180_09825 [Muribaculaceae bacterium]|nr:hypothetical protein [Roseburia sp.]MCM1431827.1 hypothetical protein [Muribaculaceae bacterium]MCM1493508.1 hypothetical protein [Muribaculaceae bacterium]
MIDEERVKELYHMAVYDVHKDRTDRQMGQYYMWDYVSKELLKSFITGTMAYALLVLLWVMSDIEGVTLLVNNLELLDLGVRLLMLYAGFMALYLLATLLVYYMRYRHGRRRLKNYEGHMTRARKLYKREDRLKS